MTDDFNKELISQAFRFYSRALVFPYDELTHELQHLFREIEKMIETDIDNTVAARILDMVNFYLGEDLVTLQAEYARLFSPLDENEPFIPLRLSSMLSERIFSDFKNLVWDSDIFIDQDEYQDSAPFVLDYFSTVLESENEKYIESFFEKYLKSFIPLLCDKISRGSSLGFYREYARGLNELVYLLDDSPVQ